MPLALHAHTHNSSFCVGVDGIAVPGNTIPVLPMQCRRSLQNVNLCGVDGSIMIRNVDFTGYVHTDWWLQGATIPKNPTVLFDMAWPSNGEVSFESFIVNFSRNEDDDDIQLLRPFWRKGKFYSTSYSDNLTSEAIGCS